MLTQDELEDVTIRLLRSASLTASPRQFFVSGLYPHLQVMLGEGEPAILVDRVLRMCQEDAYSHLPPAIVHLLERLLPNDPTVAAIVQRLRVPPPSSMDPFDALVLISKLPFLERQRTRAALRLFLQTTPTRPVVVVNGPRRAGKSYTGEFIDHVPAVPSQRAALSDRDRGGSGTVDRPW